MKRLLSVLLIAVMLVPCCLLFSGCVKNGNTDPSTLVIWHDKEEQVIAPLEEYLARALPNVTVKFERKSSLTDSLKLVGNDPNAAPDMFIFAHDKIGVFAEMKILTPITDIIGEDFESDYLPMTLSAATYKDEIYQLPLYFETLLFMYNKKYMLADEVPSTTGELLEYMKNNTGRGRYGFVEQHSTAYYSAAWIHAFGGSIINNDGTPFPNAQAVKDALAYHSEFVALMPGESEYNTVNTLFLNGKADSTIGGPWMVPSARDAGIELGIAPMPVVDSTGKALAPYSGVQGIHVLRFAAENKKDTVKLQKAWIKINDEQYIKKLSIDTRRGMVENAIKGEWNGGPTPFGYYIGDDHKLAIDPQQAIVVREIYQMYAQGINCKAIEQYLEEKKIRRDKGKPLLYNSIRNLLQNRIYIGEYHHCGIVIPDGIPAIVDEELFDSVQKMFKKNAKAPAAHTGDVDYLLTTKLFCGKCGAMMVAQAGTSQTGDVYRYYACVRQKKHICDKKTVGKEKIENYVVYKTMEFLKQEGVTDRLAKIMFELQKKESSLIPQLEDQLKEKEKIINNLADAIEEGRGSKTLIMRLEKAEDDREEIIRSIEKEKIRVPQLTLEKYKMVFERFKYLDITTEAGKRQLINAFVGAVFAYDDHFKIVYNIDGKEDSFSLSELKSSNLFSSGEPTKDAPQKRCIFRWLLSLTSFKVPHCINRLAREAYFDAASVDFNNNQTQFTPFCQISIYKC